MNKIRCRYCVSQAYNQAIHSFFSNVRNNHYIGNRILVFIVNYYKCMCFVFQVSARNAEQFASQQTLNAKGKINT